MRYDRPVLRYFLAAAVLPIGAWIVALSASLVLAQRSPSQALAIYPTADALARTAEAAVVGDSTAQDRERAMSYARRSLAQVPANSRAATALAIIAARDGDARRSVRLIRYSEAMSRRYTPAQLSLLELAVQTGDVDTALLHYDRAMRVSQDSRMTLFPVLLQASNNPAILAKVVRLMAVPSSWKSTFLDRVVAGNTSPDAIAALTAAAKLDPNDSTDSRQLTTAIANLVSSDSYAQARKVFESSCTEKMCAASPINGGFEQPNPMAPFGWDLITDGTEITSISRGNHVLEFAGSSGGPGARQLLNLTAGPYGIHTTFSVASPGSAISLALRCASPDKAIATMSAATSGRLSQRFLVPIDCPYQWLILSQAPRVDRDIDPAWVDDITIARLNQPAHLPASSATALR